MYPAIKPSRNYFHASKWPKSIQLVYDEPAVRGGIYLFLPERLGSDPITVQRSAKFLERINEPEGVRRCTMHPHVEIFRLTRFTVFHDSKTADNQVLNPKLV
jgi:hypothetical protein